MIKLIEKKPALIAASDLEEGQTMLCYGEDDFKNVIFIRPFDSQHLVKLDEPNKTYDLSSMRNVAGEVLTSGTTVTFTVE